MPRHPRCLDDTQSVADIVLDVLEVEHARVVVVLAGEECVLEVGRVHVCERVRVRVPAPEADVQATDARAVVVDDDELHRMVLGHCTSAQESTDLLVVRPELNVVCMVVRSQTDKDIEETHLCCQYDLGGAYTRCSGAGPQERAVLPYVNTGNRSGEQKRTFVWDELIDIVCVTSLYTTT